MALKDLQQRFPASAGRHFFLTTEVTRMKNGMVCVATVDVETGQCARPLSPGHHNWPEDLVKNGLRPGRVISQTVNENQHPGDYPHQTEDLILAGTMEFHDQLAPADLYATFLPLADLSVDSIFSNSLQERKFVVAHTRCRSLGSVAVSASAISFEDSYEKTRCAFQVGSTKYYATVTDLEIFKARATGSLGLLANKFASYGRSPLLLRIGLARAWSGSNDEYDPQRCYMQINGVIPPK